MTSRAETEGRQILGAAEAPAEVPQVNLNPDRRYTEFGVEDALGQHPRRARSRGDAPAMLL